MTSQPHLNQSNHEENLRLSVKSYPSLLHDNATPFYFSKLSHYFCGTIDSCGGPMHAWIMWCAHRIMHAQPQLLSFYFTNKKTKFGQSISLVCSAKDIHPMSCNNPLRVKNVSVQGRVSTQPYVRPQVRLSPLTFYIVTAHQLVLNGIMLFSSSGVLLLVCDRVDGLPPLFFVMI